MPYIVDGNNVMGQTPGWHRDKAGARRRLIDSLAAFARVKKCRITVVFDGAPEQSLPDGAAVRGVKVFYAKRGSNADDRIEQIVEASRDRRGLTIVTSDRRLAVEIRALGASVIRSGEFRKLINQAIEQAEDLEIAEEVEKEDVNSWMRYFGVLPSDDEAV